MPEPPSDFDVPSDKDAIASTPAGQSQHILVTANRYEGAPRNDHRGALLEETSAFRNSNWRTNSGLATGRRAA